MLTPEDLDRIDPAVIAGTSVQGERRVASRGGVAADSRFRIASLTKVFTATALVLTLRDRGIALTTPAVELLPDIAGDWRADPGLTVEQLLGQVSGLRESVTAVAVAALGDGRDALAETARLVVRAGGDRPPGTRWSYYNGNYFLAGAMLSAVTGVSYETALRERLLDPWRLSRTGFDPPGDAVQGWNGAAEVAQVDYPRGRRPSGGLWSCASDLLTLGEGLIGSLAEEIGQPRTAADDPMRYGLGWALGPSRQLYLNGRLPGYRAAMVLLPEHGHASVVLTNQQQALPAVAKVLSDGQRPLTGDDLTGAIDSFAA